jgi:hypothetical protein
VIRSKINVRGKVIAVFKVESPDETISGFSKKKSYDLRMERSKALIASMLRYKKETEVAILKLKWKLDI